MGAEMASVFADDDNVIIEYRKAISISKENCFLQEEALANERAGMYLLRKNNHEIASQYLIRSYNLYTLWGASVKLKHLKSNYPNVTFEKGILSQLAEVNNF